MDDFNTIRLRRKTLEEFKKYSKKVSSSYSEALDYMIAFFKDNNLSPYDTMNDNYTSYINIYNKRMDALISILRNIEKTQLIPTREMLESLFDGVEEEEEKQLLYVERTMEEIEASKSEFERLMDFYREQYEKSTKQLSETRKYLIPILEDLTYVKNTFGKDYHRLDIPKEKIEKIKTKFL